MSEADLVDIEEWAKEVGNPQLGDPLNLAMWIIHCYLHAKLRIVAKSAKTLFSLNPMFASILESVAPLRSIGKDLQSGKSSINTTGEMASGYLKNLAYLIKPLIIQTESLDMLILLANTKIMFLLRDIIGILATTSEHTTSTVNHIATLGKEALTLKTVPAGIQGSRGAALSHSALCPSSSSTAADANFLPICWRNFGYDRHECATI